jgi:hypothetical protein
MPEARTVSLIYSQALKMEVYSSETSADFYRAAQRYITQDSPLEVRGQF